MEQNAMHFEIIICFVVLSAMKGMVINMKKLIIAVIIFTLVFSNLALCDTYSYISVLNSDMKFKDNYVSKSELNETFKNLFLKETDFLKDEAGHATGYDFFESIKELGLEESVVSNSEVYYNRALTPYSLYELLEYYFPYIADLNGIESHFGKLSKSHVGYLLTYENGKTYEFSEFDYFKVKEELTDVWVIVKDENIIDICPSYKDIPFSEIINKKEILGKIFLSYEGGIIIDTGNDLLEFPVTSNFKILNKKGDKVVLIFGDYKYSKNVAAVAVGKEE